MELKEKPKASKEKDKAPKASRADKAKKTVSPAIPQKQASRMMKEKYIRELKDQPKGKGGETPQTAEQANEQAAEQVEDSGRWAAGELTGTTGHMVRQGREYAKKKAEAKKRKNPIPPVDDPAEPPAFAAPETIPPEDLGPESIPYEPPHPKTAPAVEDIMSGQGQSHPATAPKERRPKAPSMCANVPKERQLTEQKTLMERKTVLPSEGKPQQSRNVAKPLRERPVDFKIKERPSMAAPREPGRPVQSAPVPRPDRAKSGEANLNKAYEAGTPAIKYEQPRRKPKIAVPLEQRRALLDKKKASPYAVRDGVPYAPPDAPTSIDFPAPPLPPISAALPPADLPQVQGTAPAKNIFTDRAHKAFKERQQFPQKKPEAAGKPMLSLKTRRNTIKPAAGTRQQGHPEASQMAAKAAKQQAQRKMLARPKRAVRGTIDALRRVTQAAAKTVSAMTSAVTALISGGILLTSLVIVIVIAAVANSPFGLFYAQEPNAPGTVSVSQAVSSVNAAYNAKLEELQTGDSYDSIDIQGHAPDWTEVLAVFAVKLAGAEIDGLDVATLDPDRVEKLTGVFWDMTAITTEVETIDHPATDSREAWTEKNLHITITPKTADEMRTIYNFTPYQNSALDELLSDGPTLNSLAGSLDITGADERGVLAALPADLDAARRQTVENALSLVGKVNYFWGGKSRAIGWDSRWGTLQKVTAAGSRSTGTYRPFGLDCSGMIDWALRNAGLPSDGNWYIGVNLTRVSTSEARPGDMALFPDASHIGIVVGRNDAGKLLVCHCSSGRNNVVVTEFSATGFTVVGRPNIYG